MYDVPLPKLRGKIRRLQVKGPRGFRFIIIVESRLTVVLGVFVSAERKSKFDYAAVPWEQYASEIYDDLVNSRWEKFSEPVISS